MLLPELREKEGCVKVDWGYFACVGFLLLLVLLLAWALS